jgi:hypothetical protein
MQDDLLYVVRLSKKVICYVAHHVSQLVFLRGLAAGDGLPKDQLALLTDTLSRNTNVVS